MFSYLKKLLLGRKASDEGEIQPGTTIRTWTKREPERVRTYQQTTHASVGGGVSVSISLTEELATSRQLEFLKKLGFSGDGLSKEDASRLIDRVLRPVDRALVRTFRNTQILPKEHLRELQNCHRPLGLLPQTSRIRPL